MEKAESYEEAFAKIEAATGIHDIEVLVKNFIQAEEKNFALFKFVNELSNEIENLEQQISDMQMEMEQYKGQGSTSDFQRKKALKDMEEKLSKTEMKAE
jgi:predicted  nucleic acid-binding Zn-ribbon protein